VVKFTYPEDNFREKGEITSFRFVLIILIKFCCLASGLRNTGVGPQQLVDIFGNSPSQMANRRPICVFSRGKKQFFKKVITVFLVNKVSFSIKNEDIGGEKDLLGKESSYIPK